VAEDPFLKDPFAYLRGAQTRAGLVARRDLLRQPRPEDGDVARRLADAVHAEQRPDGSWGGLVYDTAWALWQLADLGFGATAPAQHGVEWLLSRQDAGTAYAPGFFGSEGSGKGRKIRLFTGDLVTHASAIFEESNFALRSLLRLGHGDDEGVRRALEALVDLFEDAARRSDAEGRTPSARSLYCCTKCTLSGLEAFALWDDVRGERMGEWGIEWIASRQLQDGDWRGLPFYYTLDVLNRYDLPLARSVYRAALPAIARRQNADGSWGRSRKDELTLIVATGLAKYELLDG
jgi:hypothetical protein